MTKERTRTKSVHKVCRKKEQIKKMTSLLNWVLIGRRHISAVAKAAGGSITALGGGDARRIKRGGLRTVGSVAIK